MQGICSTSSESSQSKGWIVHGLLAGAAAAVGLYMIVRSNSGRKRVVGIIPARYRSSRFEGKPLISIRGKPMIQSYGRFLRHRIFEIIFTGSHFWNVHLESVLFQLLFSKRTWERAKMASTLDNVVIATDDERIAKCCLGFGANVVMTSEACRNGTERCNEALRKLKKKYDIVVNIQGDEPLVEPEIIDGVVKALQGAPDAVFSTAVTSLNPEDALDPNRVKCVVDKNGYAIYFSRGLIPYNKEGEVNPKFPYLLHLGIQSYDAKFLGVYPLLQPTPLQLEEDLEQLKVLENGYKMKVIKVQHDAHGVDIPSDVAKIEALMQERNIP